MAHEQSETWIDKSAWGDGPWTTEPDRMEWRDNKTGVPCLALRNPVFGGWCGYVGIPPGHPWHGSDYEAIDMHSAHGGLTFAAPCDPQEGPDRVCHVPMPGEPDDVFWVGFDCTHNGDLSPGQEAYERRNGLSSFRADDRTYRTLEYVRSICTLMAYEVADV